MTTNRDVDRITDAWLADGPTELSDHAFRAAMADIHATPQQHARRLPWVRRVTILVVRLATLGMLLAAIAVVGVAVLRPTPTRVGTASPSPLIPADHGAFTQTGPMVEVRWGSAATLLSGGRVLIVGGTTGTISGDAASTTAEIWDPHTGGFTQTGSLAEGRYQPTATLLGNGQVLVAGGTDTFRPGWSTAELWDPTTGAFSAAGSLHAAAPGAPTLLPDGRVLFGRGGSAEIWDPGTRSFGPAGSLGDTVAIPDGTALADGRVLVIHGDGSAVVWDPDTGAFSPAGSLALPRHAGFTDNFNGLATALLRDGRVLIVGGSNTWERPAPSDCGSPCRLGGRDDFAAAEIWDPSTGVFSPTGSLAEPRRDATATLLSDGRVLVVGMHSTERDWAYAELFQLK